jgi:hypothetical protein
MKLREHCPYGSLVNTRRPAGKAKGTARQLHESPHILDL